MEKLEELLKKIRELEEDNLRLIAYIDGNVGCATVCNDCSCGKKEMLEINDK